jgi:hypothetical protein
MEYVYLKVSEVISMTTRLMLTLLYFALAINSSIRLGHRTGKSTEARLTIASLSWSAIIFGC